MAVYRSEDVAVVLAGIREAEGADAITGPNVLESRGDRFLREQSSRWTKAVRASEHTLLPRRAACLSSPSLVVVTVNRVQDLFQNDVYACDLKSKAEEDE